MQRRLFLLPCILLLCCCPPRTLVSASAESVPDPLTPTFALMREALHQALQLRFTAALEVAMRLEQQPAPHLLEAQLMRGMIAYFQARWQIPPPSTARQAGLKELAALLEAGQRQLTRAPRTARLQLVLGLAAIFRGLLQQQSGASLDFALLAQGRTWLQQALMAPETMPDAHLGLGLLYVMDLGRSGLSLWLAGAGREHTTEAIYHLRQAAETGHFSAEVARAFLVRVYALEQRYEEAIALGQALQSTFPSNGYYALSSGRSQCALGQYALCATTLGQLAADLQAAVIAPLSRDDRFDLYYFWGQALYETGQDALAFEAFRQAINQDLGNTKGASLWAKYYLGILYERRGAVKTARQLYHTLLRGRNVDDLHQQVEQRLARLREG